MSWLQDESGVELGWKGINVFFPDVTEAIVSLHRVIWEKCDPVLLELGRLRIATLLKFEPGLALRSDLARAAGLSEGKIEALNLWPSSPLFTPRERACLALTEQILMSASDVTDELVNEVLEYLSPAECYTFVEGISAMETLQRGSLVLKLTTSPEEGWLTSVSTPS
jgi:alkylhydroperoxidase family enzyme